MADFNILAYVEKETGDVLNTEGVRKQLPNCSQGYSHEQS